MEKLPAPPKSWSELTWSQLCSCWQCKMRYGENADVARAAALLALYGLRSETGVRGNETEGFDLATGESIYTLVSNAGDIADGMHGADHAEIWQVTPRELSQIAKAALPWFDWPYGDPGDPAEKDEKGNITKEARDPVSGYVNPDFKDALALPEETLVVCGRRIITGSEWRVQGERLLAEGHGGPIHFSVPSVALYNLTWQQYRSLQTIAPQLFQDSVSDDDVLGLQASFLAHILVPAKEDTVSADRFAPSHRFVYDAERAEQTVAFWRHMLQQEPRDSDVPPASVLFHILFQVYQTALSYYSQVFPLLFGGGGKSDSLQDALTGEVRTINAVMKYQGYTKPEDVYEENLPIILSTLNTMAEEAKQIEQMNAKIKKK